MQSHMKYFCWFLFFSILVMKMVMEKNNYLFIFWIWNQTSVLPLSCSHLRSNDVGYQNYGTNLKIPQFKNKNLFSEFNAHLLHLTWGTISRLSLQL